MHNPIFFSWHSFSWINWHLHYFIISVVEEIVHLGTHVQNHMWQSNMKIRDVICHKEGHIGLMSHLMCCSKWLWASKACNELSNVYNANLIKIAASSESHLISYMQIVADEVVMHAGKKQSAYIEHILCLQANKIWALPCCLPLVKTHHLYAVGITNAIKGQV